MRKIYSIILVFITSLTTGLCDDIRIYSLTFGNQSGHLFSIYKLNSAREIIIEDRERGFNDFNIPLDSARIIQCNVTLQSKIALYIAYPGQKKKEWKSINIPSQTLYTTLRDSLLKNGIFESISVKAIFPMQNKKRMTLQKPSGEMIIVELDYRYAQNYVPTDSHFLLISNHDYNKLQSEFAGKYGYAPLNLRARTKNETVIDIPKLTKITCDSVVLDIESRLEGVDGTIELENVNMICHTDSIKNIIVPYDQYNTLLNQNEHDSVLYAEKVKLIAEQQQKEYKAKLQKEKEIQAAEQKAKRAIEIIRKYGKYYGNLILAGKVQLGMTKQMCIEVWEEPIDVNTTITPGNVNEQWVYSLDCYLYFDNGILTAIQN